MSQGLIENIAVSGVFWLLDIIIIVMLLPLVLKIYEDRKWKPMREAVVGTFVKYRDAVYHEFIGTIEHAIEHPEMSPVEGNKVGRGAERCFNRMKSDIDLLGQSLTPDMALPVIDAYDAAEDLSRRLVYVFDMRARGHPMKSVKRVVSEICDAADRFDQSIDILLNIYPSRYQLMNTGFGFVKYFLDQWVEAIENISPTALAKPLHPEPKQK